MTALAVAPVGDSRHFRLVAVDSNEINSGPMQPQVEFTSARLTEPGLDDDRRLKIGGRRHQPERVGLDRGLEALRLRLITKRRDEGGCVDHHQVGNPCSS